jgi:hypothetical protein
VSIGAHQLFTANDRPLSHQKSVREALIKQIDSAKQLL